MPGIALTPRDTVVNETDTVSDLTGLILFELGAVYCRG